MDMPRRQASEVNLGAAPVVTVLTLLGQDAAVPIARALVVRGLISVEATPGATWLRPHQGDRLGS